MSQYNKIGEYMTNKKIEKKAIAIVIKYEKSHGRKAIEIKQGKGYDIDSSGRKIEVKGIAKRYPGWRLMDEHHFKAIQKHNDYFLYIVEYVDSDNPFLYIMPRDEIIKHLWAKVTWTMGLPRKQIEAFREDLP